MASNYDPNAFSVWPGFDFGMQPAEKLYSEDPSAYSALMQYADPQTVMNAQASQPSAAAPAPAWEGLLNKLMNKQAQGISDQRANIDVLRKYKDKIAKQPLERDLSALMMASDAWGGTNFQSKYQRPKTQADLDREMLGVDLEIQKSLGGITDDEINLLKAQLDAEIQREKNKEDKNKKRELTAANVLTVNEGNAIPAILDDIEATIENNKDTFGYNTSFEGSIAGRYLTPQKYEKIQTMDSQLRSASQAFGKFMEGGVLRKEDEEKYRKMFPSRTDTPEVAKNKLANVRRLLLTKQNSDLKALDAQGFDTSGLNPGMKPPDVPGVLKGNQQPSSLQYSDPDKEKRYQEWKKNNP